MSLPEIVGLVTGGLTIIGTIIAVTVYMAKLRADVDKAKLETELNNAKNQLQTVNANYAELETRHKRTVVAGSHLAGKKQAIDLELALLSDGLGAMSSSVLVPVPSEDIQDKVSELVFLTLLGEGSEKLKGIHVPLESIAGDVYTTGRSRLIHKARDTSETSAKTDQVSETQSNDLLALPLKFQGKSIGVIEFLNKKEGDPFDDSDLQHAERNISSIALKVGEFIQDPKSFQLIGITPKRRPDQAAILFSDLSQSSRLVSSLDASLVTDILNQYFEALGTIAINHGGRIDKFIGDGFMTTFNVQYSVRDPELQACAAALEMNKAFDELKKKWNVFNAPELFNRIGIDSGPVHKVEIGHSHLKQITVMGNAVNVASNLCQIGRRDRNTIIVGDSVFKKVISKFNADRVEAGDLSKPLPTVQRAYQLSSKT